jgi:UDP-N-acetylmuramate dehydrogenase
VQTSVLLAETTRRGLGGLQCLVGYPATVGGAARMNAGGKWGETGTRIESVRVVDGDGVLRELAQEACGFGYRRSVFGPMLVVEVSFRLPRTDLVAYRAEIAAIHREKSALQPLGAASAGCMFRNPAGQSAGRLIDVCGMKGHARGGAIVSPRHGNFFENRGGATCEDVLRLADEVTEAVLRRSGVELRMEVEVWRRGHVPGGH